MSLTAKLTARISAVQSGPNDFTSQYSPRVEKLVSLANGTGVGQADLIFCDERTVTTGANDDIDLTGVLKDAFGSNFDAAEIVAIIIINAPASGTANTTDLTIGAATNPFIGFLGGTTPTVGPLKPGAFFMMGAGDAAGIGAVTAGTGDILRIANSAGASAVYQIGIIGRSA